MNNDSSNSSPIIPETPATSATTPASRGTRKLAPKASRERFKPQLSCTFCRTRKLKCDRNQPCDNCVKKNVSCTFIHAGRGGGIHENSTLSNIQKRPRSGENDVQDRVRKLEQMVISLMNDPSARSGSPAGHPKPAMGNGLHLEPPTSNGPNESTHSFGRISTEDYQPNYIGGTHWASILDNITELKQSLKEASQSPYPLAESRQISDGPELLLGANRKIAKDEILTSIPSRPFVDHLVKLFLENMDLVSTIFHVPTFKKEYEKFWADPHSTPTIWLGLLFSIMSLAIHFQTLSEIPPAPTIMSSQALRTPEHLSRLFREKTVQCLVLANYTEPVPYTIETLFLYAITETLRNSDTQFGIWIVIGIIVRTAMRMGYHRDASHFPSISVFRGEMQRRIWATIMNFDVRTSCQIGLPSMIKKEMSDTQLPRNLLDEDFDEDTVVLPPPRLASESTPIAYIIARQRVTEVFGMIVDQADSIHSILYSSVLHLDSVLQSVEENIPDFLKVRSIADLQTGLPKFLMRKFSIALSIQKSRCILHRKFFVSSKELREGKGQDYTYSIQSCLDAAMTILQYQSLLYCESKPGGSLYAHRWKMSSIMVHDFLLAGMLVCLYLDYSISRGSTEVGGTTVKWSREDILVALEGSHKLWEDISRKSNEALKAAMMLKTMLAKVRSADLRRMKDTSGEMKADKSQDATCTGKFENLEVQSSYGALSKNFGHVGNKSPTRQDQEGQINGTNPSMSWPISSIPQYQVALGEDSLMSPDFIENVLNAPMSLDWELMWDSNFQCTAASDTPPEFWNFETQS